MGKLVYIEDNDEIDDLLPDNEVMDYLRRSAGLDPRYNMGFIEIGEGI